MDEQQRKRSSFHFEGLNIERRESGVENIPSFNFVVPSPNNEMDSINELIQTYDMNPSTIQNLKKISKFRLLYAFETALTPSQREQPERGGGQALHREHRPGEKNKELAGRKQEPARAR